MPPLFPDRRPSARDSRALLVHILTAWPECPDGLEQIALSNWKAVLDLAERHGVLGILHRNLLDTAGKQFPEIGQRIEERRMLEQLWAGSLVATLGEAFAALRAAGIPTLALKGPVLSERLYQDALTRVSSDLDLLVMDTDFNRAQKVLEELGYSAESGPTARYRMTYHHHLSLTSPRRMPLELHFRAYAGFGTTISAEEVFIRSRPFQCRDGNSYLIMAPEDEIVYLCVHAAGHDCERLAWIHDIKVFLQLHPDLSWRVIFQRAESQRVLVPLTFALEWARRQLNAASPVMPYRAIGRRRAAAQLLTWLHEQRPHSKQAKAGSLTFQALLCDRISQSAWFLQHHLTRIARRRLQRWLPGLTPSEWSG